MRIKSSTLIGYIRVGVPVTFLPLKLTREIQFAGARGSIPRHGIFFWPFLLLLQANVTWYSAFLVGQFGGLILGLSGRLANTGLSVLVYCARTPSLKQHINVKTALRWHNIGVWGRLNYNTGIKSPRRQWLMRLRYDRPFVFLVVDDFYGFVCFSIEEVSLRSAPWIREPNPKDLEHGLGLLREQWQRI